MPKSIYVLRAHEINNVVKKLYNKLVIDLGYDNVFILYDATNNKFPKDSDIAIDKVCIINDEYCLENNSFHNKGFKEGSVSMSFWHPETSFVAIGYWLLIVKKIEYDYIWFIEYDVYCNGNFKNVFQKCDNIKADFMARGRDEGIENFRIGFQDAWCWWNELNGDVEDVPKKYRVGCFLPLVRCSKLMIDKMREQFNKSTGFCEIYMSTLALRENLFIKPLPLEVLGIFRYRPFITDKEISEFKGGQDLFFHPAR